MSILLIFSSYLFETALACLIGLIGFIYVMFSRRPPPTQMPVDRNRQSKPLPGGDESTRVNSILGEDCQLIDNVYGVKTLYECFQRGLGKSRDQPFLGTRQPNQPYQYQTYAEIEERITNFGSGLINRGHITGQGTFVGIASKNCPEWVIVEESCHAYSQILVPLYDTLGQEGIEHIVTQANTEVIVLSNDKFAERFKFVAATKIPKLVVKIGTVTEEETALATEQGMQLVSMATIEEEGKNTRADHVPPRPDDLASICYTSGTTGKPKGVMISHNNLASDCAGAMTVLNQNVPFNENDVYISYLPLAHVYERSMQTSVTMNGGRICFYQGDVRILMEDIAACRPTIFVSVPRLLNRIYDRTMALVNSSSLKRKLFNMAMRSKQADIRRGIVCNTTIWDKLVFKRIQTSLGGRLRLIASAAAPIDPQIMNFLRCAIGCYIIEGYGQTEATAGTTLQFPSELNLGNVGPPLPCNIIRLIDVPEMNYYARNGEGEVCFKGPNVFKGYLNDEAKTREALDSDGWLHSGDIGKWTENGCLKIIDRKKNIVKLSNGEYIAPEKIEGCYNLHPAVVQAFVHANSLYPFPIAIIVADPDTFVGWAEKRGVKGSIEDLCKNKDLVKAIVAELDTAGREQGLNSFERIKQVCIIRDQFTIENGMLTPTLKLKRAEIVKTNKEIIDMLLESMKQSGATK